MIFSCERQTIYEAVNIVMRASAVKSAKPVLEGILISSDENNLILCANNLEYAIECKIPADIREEGSVVFDSKILFDIIRSLPGNEINFNVAENLVTRIQSNQSTYDIMGLDPSDFPELPVIREQSSFTIEPEILKGMIRQTIHAVSVKTENPVLTGSLFEIENNVLTVVSLDRFKLAKRTEGLSSPAENVKFIVPAKTLSEVLKILSDDSGLVKVSVNEKYVLFEFENVKVFSRLIEGEYFNYKTIIPSDFKIKTKVNLSDIKACVERTNPIVSVDVFKNPIMITVHYDTVTIDCMTATGKVHDVFDIENCNAEIKICFNQRYLLEALSSCECEEILMEFNGEHSPCIIIPTEGDSFLQMVMPVRMKSTD